MSETVWVKSASIKSTSRAIASLSVAITRFATAEIFSVVPNVKFVCEKESRIFMCLQIYTKITDYPRMKINEIDIHAALKTYFGFSQFKGLQEQVIRSILSRQSTFVIMPTGGGKSLCYQLPAMM